MRCCVVIYIIDIHPKTIENIQILPKISELNQKIVFHVLCIYINQTMNHRVDVSNKWIDENEIWANKIIFINHNNENNAKNHDCCNI